MKAPQNPPPWQEILDQVAKADRLGVILPALQDEGLQPKKYLHWDALRFRAAPEGLSHREWWLLAKLRRSNLYQRLPNVDGANQPFQFANWHSILEHLHRIDMDLGGVIQMSEAVASSEMKDRYLVRSLMEEAITSSQLEGAVTTRKVAKEMIRTRRPPRDESEQMILNNYRTMRRISREKKLPLTPELVLGIHRTITEETLEDTSATGRLRRQDERVRVEDMYGTVFHDPPDADSLSHRLEKMCDFANSRTPDYFLHPVLRSIILHFWLAYGHPFVDGNGRVARALFYWSMLRNGYWLCEFISISQIIRKAQAQYNRAFLHTETDENDLTYFLIHQLGTIRKAIAELHGYIKRETDRMRVLRRRVRGFDLLNHRQRPLIEHALAHFDADYTIQGHLVSHNVVYETARSDLLDLERRGLLISRKVGRTLHFRPAQDLEQCLNRMM